jgi:hypothetical protein
MAGTAIKENDMNTEYESKLLRKNDTLMRMDVFVNDPRVLEDVREAMAAGLTPTSFSIHADVVVLRLDREEA